MRAALLLLLVVSLAGCVLPSVTLGASLGWTRGQMDEAHDGRAFVRARSAVFVRVGAALDARLDSLEPADGSDALEAPAPEPGSLSEAPACAIEPACAWERAEVASADRLWRATQDARALGRTP
jgi:hypothetical protein